MYDLREENIKSDGRKTRFMLRISTFALSVVVLLAFLLHLFIYAVSSKVYIALVVGFAVIYACSKKIYVAKGNVRWGIELWLMPLLILLCNYIFRYQANSVLMDNAVLFSGFILVICFSDDSEEYGKVVSLVKYVSMFFAIGVLLQKFFPSLYQAIMAIFPSQLANVIRSGSENTATAGLNGFTTNTGFTVNYIFVGILAIISERISLKDGRRSNSILLVLMALALLFTGKRAPIMFAVLSLMLVYLIPSRGSEKLRRLWRILLIVIGVIVFYLVFRDFLAQIPGLGKIVLLVDKITAGEDASSGRTRLYLWAIEQFRTHPIFGIGWGRYSSTVVGVATYSKVLDVHNVYLQLLCETGIVGFLCFCSAFIVSWVMAKNSFCQCVTLENEITAKWKPILFFSFCFQTYFLFYCLTGNPLYDQFYQILYMFSCSMVTGYRFVSDRNCVATL